MRRIKAKAVYSLSTLDGREVGTVFETHDRRLVLQLDRGFHEDAREGRGAEPDVPPSLVIRPIP